MWCEVEVQIYSFTCKYQVVPALFVEKTILSPTELAWHPCPKSIDHKFKGLVLFSKFYPIDLYVYPICQYHTVFFFWPHRTAYGILVPQPGTEPGHGSESPES